MARARTYPRLSVFMNGRLTGFFDKSPGGAVEFRYASEWLDRPGAMPVSLSLPLREDPYTGAGVLAVFDNLLPDSEDIRRRMAEQIGAAGTDAYSLLAAAGRDCVGALQFLPEGAEPGQPGAIESEPLSTAQTAKLLRNLHRAPLGLDKGDAFRISLAGAQEKTALLRTAEGWAKPLGATPTTHIFKPAIGRRGEIDLTDSVENEYFCMQLLAELGLPTAGCEMATFEDVRTLVVERFDRLWTSDGRLLRIPQEDFCQALGRLPSQRYEADGGPGPVEILRLLMGSDTPDQDRVRFLSACAIYCLTAATDGHAKNFSIFLYPGGGFAMTPLYDVMSVQPNYARREIARRQVKMAMAFGANRHHAVHRLRKRHFLETAQAAGFGGAEVELALDELVDRIPAALDTVWQRLPQDFPQSIAEQITAGVKERLAVWRD